MMDFLIMSAAIFNYIPPFFFIFFRMRQFPVPFLIIISSCSLSKTLNREDAHFVKLDRTQTAVNKKIFSPTVSF